MDQITQCMRPVNMSPIYRQDRFLLLHRKPVWKKAKRQRYKIPSSNPHFSPRFSNLTCRTKKACIPLLRDSLRLHKEWWVRGQDEVVTNPLGLRRRQASTAWLSRQNEFLNLLSLQLLKFTENRYKRQATPKLCLIKNTFTTSAQVKNLRLSWTHQRPAENAGPARPYTLVLVKPLQTTQE